MTKVSEDVEIRFSTFFLVLLVDEDQDDDDDDEIDEPDEVDEDLLPQKKSIRKKEETPQKITGKIHFKFSIQMIFRCSSTGIPTIKPIDMNSSRTMTRGQQKAPGLLKIQCHFY